MEIIYSVSGMTCGGCVSSVRKVLVVHPEVRSVSVSLVPPQAVVASEAHIPVEELNALFQGTHYTIADSDSPVEVQQDSQVDRAVPKGWIATYYPLLLVFAFITVVSHLTSSIHGHFHAAGFMAHFMAGFFIVFSFFKLLDVRAFENAYAGYDLLAMRWKDYGRIYPFIEFALGLGYLMPRFAHSTLLNATTVVVMGFSTLGVLRAVINKQRIQCACLGTVFNLPMSTVTIVEDLLMVAMAIAMLVMG